MKKFILLILVSFGLTACSSSDPEIVPPEYQGLWLGEGTTENLRDLSFTTANEICDHFWDGETYALFPIEIHRDGLVSMVVVDEDGIFAFADDAPFGYIYEDFSFELSDFTQAQSDDFNTIFMNSIEFFGPGFGEAELSIYGVTPFGADVSMNYTQVTEDDLYIFNDMLSTFCR